MPPPPDVTEVIDASAWLDDCDPELDDELDDLPVLVVWLVPPPPAGGLDELVPHASARPITAR